MRMTDHTPGLIVPRLEPCFQRWLLTYSFRRDVACYVSAKEIHFAGGEDMGYFDC